MGLFQRKPSTTEQMQYYTVGLTRVILVVGLGNIGSQYEGTRHNVGFACADRFARDNDFPAWVEKSDLMCHLSSTKLGDSKVIIIKPTTFMNLSGEAVQATVNFYKVGPKDIVVVHDDLDVPFGQIRVRSGGSSAGHNGIKSVSQYIGEEYGRIRVGIGPKVPEQIDSADFVLGRFPPEQQAHMDDLTREASAILSEYIFGGQLVTETRSFML